MPLEQDTYNINREFTKVRKMWQPRLTPEAFAILLDIHFELYGIPKDV